MRKRAAALALALCVGLSGCALEREGRREDASLLGRAAELAEETILLSVDGREIPAWRYLYWLAFTCDQIREKYEDGGMALDWGAPVTGGTLADYAKDQALADTALYATVENWAERYGCVLSEKERASLTGLWEEQSEAHGGEEAYLGELADLGLDRLRAEELAEVGMLYAKLYELVLTEGSELSELLEPAEGLTVDRILIGAGEDREAAREEAAAPSTGACSFSSTERASTVSRRMAAPPVRGGQSPSSRPASSPRNCTAPQRQPETAWRS